MPKVAIVTDSIACLAPEIVRQYGLRIAPITIYFEDKIYRDGVNITPAEAYRFIEKAPDQFASSPSSVGDFLEAYEEQSIQSESILCITLSSRMSTSYEMACVAKEEARNKLPGTNIEVIDSMTVAGGEGLIVLAAARTAAEDRSLTEVIKVTNAVKERINVLGILETIRHVYRTGRIPKSAARLGSMLNIKPMIAIIGGEVRVTGLARNKENGIKRILATMRERIGTNPVHVTISHANVLDEGEKLKECISAEFNCAELWLSDFSPVMGYSTGPGTLTVAFYPSL